MRKLSGQKYCVTRSMRKSDVAGGEPLNELRRAHCRGGYFRRTDEAPYRASNRHCGSGIERLYRIDEVAHVIQLCCDDRQPYGAGFDKRQSEGLQRRREDECICQGIKLTESRGINLAVVD